MARSTSPIASLPSFVSDTDEGVNAVWRQSARARLFAVTFSFTLALGFGWTLLQPIEYRSNATVLMSAPSAIDVTIEAANIQNVAIQRRILLGGEVTQSLLSDLDGTAFADVDLHYLRKALQVEAVDDTNLVELSARGAEAEILPTLVNTWIDAYLDIRANDIQQSQEQTLEIVEGQLTGLELRLEEARDALATYRSDNHITSVERQQNEELARLEGLNSALNNAVKAEVKTKANLESLREAIAAGKNVVPPSNRKSVENMENDLRQLQTKMAKLSKTYTMNYILNQPSLRDIPEDIAELEAALEEELENGKELSLAQAEYEHAAALQTMEDLQKKLVLQEQDAALFTTVYAKHEALAKDLAELEALNRETQSRLIQVQVNQVEKYPQVSIIERPGPESERVGPDYLLLLGVSIAAALGLGVLSVWLYGFLGPRPARPAFVTLSGVHMYPQEVSGQLTYTAQEEHRIGRSDTPLLKSEHAPNTAEKPGEDSA